MLYLLDKAKSSWSQQLCTQFLMENQGNKNKSVTPLELFAETSSEIPNSVMAWRVDIVCVLQRSAETAVCCIQDILLYLQSTMMELYNSQIALNQSTPVSRASTRVPWSEKWFFINLDVMVVTPQCRLHLSLTSNFLMFLHSLCILLFIFFRRVSVRISLFRYF